MDNHPKNFIRIWFQAIKFPSLTASFISAMLGGAFALMDRAFQSVPFLLALLGSMLIQAGTNLFNDYFDYKSGVESIGALSPNSVIKENLLTGRQVYRGGIICFILAVLLGLYLAVKVGNGVLWFGLIGLLLGYGYSGGPYPLANRALGELAVFISMGPLLVLATYFVQVGILRWAVFWSSIPIGLLAASVVYANNILYRQQNPSSGKITLANLFSEKGGKLVFTILILSIYTVQLILIAIGILHWLTLISFFSLPIAINLIRKTWKSTSPLELNLVVGLTVLVQLIFGMGYALGLFGSILFI